MVACEIVKEMETEEEECPKILKFIYMYWYLSIHNEVLLD